MDEKKILEEQSALKEKILNEYPRLKEEDTFEFACHPGVSCFTACCADINIVLTPYDVLRMKNHLEMDSKEFLDRYTVTIGTKDLQMPVVMLKMDEDKDGKPCPFVDPVKGCSIYEARPWPCRMYPLGAASPSDGNAPIDEPFFFLMHEEMCKGFAESGGKTWTVLEWIGDQGIAEHNEMGELWKQITLHKFFREGGELTTQKMGMLFMACYDLDKFRRFVFESTFLKKFEVEPETVEAIRGDDVELLKFAFRWLRFALFNEATVPVRGEVAEKARREAERYDKKNPAGN